MTYKRLFFTPDQITKRLVPVAAHLTTLIPAHAVPPFDKTKAIVRLHRVDEDAGVVTLKITFAGASIDFRVTYEAIADTAAFNHIVEQHVIHTYKKLMCRG